MGLFSKSKSSEPAQTLEQKAKAIGISMILSDPNPELPDTSIINGVPYRKKLIKGTGATETEADDRMLDKYAKPLSPVLMSNVTRYTSIHANGKTTEAKVYFINGKVGAKA